MLIDKLSGLKLAKFYASKLIGYCMYAAGYVLRF